MKTNFFIAAVLTLCCTFNSVADADASRKNKCKNGKHYKASAKTKGGTANCGNMPVGFPWTCANNGPSNVVARHNSTGGACTCGDFTNASLFKAAEATGTSNSGNLSTFQAVYEFGCGFPNKWKAGASSVMNNFSTCSPMIIQKNPPSISYEMSGSLLATDVIFDYSASTVKLIDFDAMLKKNTPDMINDYTTFVIDVSIVTGLDTRGNEITTSIYNCKATIFDNTLVVEDASNSIQSSDFTSSVFGTKGVQFGLTKDGLLLNLSRAINDGMEINVTFSTDSGNYEEGSNSKFAATPTSIEKLSQDIKANQNISLSVLSNPVVSEDIEFTAAIKSNKDGETTKFVVRDIEGKVVREMSVSVNPSEQKFTISSAGLSNGVYLLSIIYQDKEYARKFIVSKAE